MLSLSPAQLRVVRTGLFISTFGWGISFFFTIDSWSDAVNRLYDMGASEIAYQPLLGYWLKMASAVFGGIGVVSAAAFVRPERFTSVIRVLPPFHLVLGLILCHAAYTNGLTPSRHPTFLFDIAFCFAVAALIGLPLLFVRRVDPAALR